MNYPFFALDHPGAWARALGPLWRRFWERYLAETGDAAVLESAPPYLAWRALVLACSALLPAPLRAARDALLALAERALDAGRLELDLPGGALPGARP